VGGNELRREILRPINPSQEPAPLYFSKPHSNIRRASSFRLRCSFVAAFSTSAAAPSAS